MYPSAAAAPPTYGLYVSIGWVMITFLTNLLWNETTAGFKQCSAAGGFTGWAIEVVKQEPKGVVGLYGGEKGAPY